MKLKTSLLICFIIFFKIIYCQADLIVAPIKKTVIKKRVNNDISRISTTSNSPSKIGKFAALDINADESKFYFTPLVLTKTYNNSEQTFKHIHSINISGAVNGSNIFDFKKKSTLALGYSYTKIDSNLISKYNTSTTNVLFWWKANFNPISFDNFKIIDETNTSTYNAPIVKSVYTPNASLSGNYLWSKDDDSKQLYLSAFAKLICKHTLSEFSETAEWTKYQKLSDTTFLTADKSDVFAINESDFSQKLKVDFGIQATYLFSVWSKYKIKTGIDFSLTYKSIVATNNNANAIVGTVGLIFPFVDKDGETTINIEPFYSWTNFGKVDLENRTFFGVKFGLPFKLPE